VPNVVKVILQLNQGILFAGAVTVIDLRPSCQPWLYRQPRPVEGMLFCR
jgi:hypothetical protein